MTAMKPPRKTCRMNFRRRSRTAISSRHGICDCSIMLAMSSEGWNRKSLDWQRVANVLLHEQVDVRDLRARNEHDVERTQGDVERGIVAVLDRADVDNFADRHPVRTLADQKHLL